MMKNSIHFIGKMFFIYQAVYAKTLLPKTSGGHYNFLLHNLWGT